jgi:hypothetical protein
MSRTLIALLASALAALPLAAQQPPPQPGIRRGAEVRVHTQHSLVDGRLIGLSPTTLVIAQDGQAVILARSEVVEMQVRANGRWTPVPTDRLPHAWDSLPGPAGAGGVTALAGIRVRVANGNRRRTGRLVEWRRDTVVVADSRGRTRAIPVGPDTRMHVSARRGNAALGGLVTGLVLGAGGGAAAAGGFCNSLSFGGADDCGGAAVGGAALGGLLLGVIGVGVGAAIKTEGWIEIPADSVRAFVNPSPRRPSS